MPALSIVFIHMFLLPAMLRRKIVRECRSIERSIGIVAGLSIIMWCWLPQLAVRAG
jgi:hypothetical protein